MAEYWDDCDAEGGSESEDLLVSFKSIGGGVLIERSLRKSAPRS